MFCFFEALEPTPRPPSLLRSLLGVRSLSLPSETRQVLALGGRLVTTTARWLTFSPFLGPIATVRLARLELSPHEAQHLWAKECSISFFNPHGTCRHGELLHAAVEVCGRLAAKELPTTEPLGLELFERFQEAYERAQRELVVLLL